MTPPDMMTEHHKKAIEAYEAGLEYSVPSQEEISLKFHARNTGRERVLVALTKEAADLARPIVEQFIEQAEVWISKLEKDEQTRDEDYGLKACPSCFCYSIRLAVLRLRNYLPPTDAESRNAPGKMLPWLSE